jgi:hypothetical protein
MGRSSSSFLRHAEAGGGMGGGGGERRELTEEERRARIGEKMSPGDGQMDYVLSASPSPSSKRDEEELIFRNDEKQRHRCQRGRRTETSSLRTGRTSNRICIQSALLLFFCFSPFRN